MTTSTHTAVFGPLMKSLRAQKRVTLREFCKRANADPGNVSRIERAVWSPPQDHDILERYARALDLKEGTDDWYRFFDSAAADRGIVPKDIMSEEEVVKVLPVLFRTIRRTKPTEEDLDRLVEKLRRS